jgi:hypothetical protein
MGGRQLVEQADRTVHLRLATNPHGVWDNLPALVKMLQFSMQDMQPL